MLSLPSALSVVALLLFVLVPGRVAIAQTAGASVRTGQALFHDKGCEHCHGPNGVGGEKGPSLVSVGRTLKPAQLQQQIYNGGKGMPAFSEVLAPDEISALVDFLRTKREKPLKPRIATNRASPTQKPGSAGSGGSDDQ